MTKSLMAALGGRELRLLTWKGGLGWKYAFGNLGQTNKGAATKCAKRWAAFPMPRSLDQCNHSHPRSPGRDQVLRRLAIAVAGFLPWMGPHLFFSGST